LVIVAQVFIVGLTALQNLDCVILLYEFYCSL